MWQGITAEQFPHRCPEIYRCLRKIDSEIAGGTAALIALIVNNHLYVANVGMLLICDITIYCLNCLVTVHMGIDHRVDRGNVPPTF